MRTEISLKDRLNHQLHCHLHRPITQRRYPQRTLTAVRLWNHEAPYRLGAVGLFSQITGQLPQKRFYPFATLYGLETHPVYAGSGWLGQVARRDRGCLPG